METYHRKVERRQLPSLRITNQKISSDMEILSHKLEKMEKEICDAI